MIARGGIIGLAGGIILGIFLKGIQALTGLKVYTLLLNVDFIYSKPLPEWVEFGIHLAVAVPIGIGFILIRDWLKFITLLKQSALALLITIPAGFLYFPLSILANKNVPSVYDIRAFGWWAAAHLVFAGVLVWGGWIVRRSASN
ncbi:hypothetical protein J9317_08645 [Metabacillus sp. KIGAM252]|uniref:Uncharacterized protein n=1 Tax=Metabacillus flavus TaxID=2823519 RepID=A0ABS5LEJ9_9BACI|nr:hypothetical protein [Metabacillus flavus]MBS2968824.1 hypothetical protein [Metabacillus flavus]